MDELEISFEGDIHICGPCQNKEITINDFLNHKQICSKSRKKHNLFLESTDSLPFNVLPNNLVDDCSNILNSDNVHEINFTTLHPVATGEGPNDDSDSRSPTMDQHYILPSTTNSVKECESLSAFETSEMLDLQTDKLVCNLENAVVNGVQVESAGETNPREENMVNKLECSTRITTNVIQQPSINRKETKYEIVKNPDTGTKRYQCTFKKCYYSSMYTKDVLRHYNTHTGEKPFFCKLCDKRFSRLDKLKVHELTHQNIKPHKCTECNYSATDRSSLVKHNRIHKDERPYKCQICKYASRNSSQLTVHLRSHTGDTPFHCTMCKLKFKVNSDLKRHMFLHTGEKPFACPKCSFRCNTKSNLKTHIRLKHREKPDELTCSQCGFVTSSKSSFRDHARCHSNLPMHCNQCQYSTTTLVALKAHQAVHNRDKPFKCENCSYASRQACNVITHVKRFHTEVLEDSQKPKGNLRKKESKRKLNEKIHPLCSKSFKCSMCSASFVRQDSLECHLRHHRNQMTQSVAQFVLPENQRECQIFASNCDSIERTVRTMVSLSTTDAEVESFRQTNTSINQSNFISQNLETSIILTNVNENNADQTSFIVLPPFV